MKRRALASALSLKAKNQEVVAVSGVEKLVKTKSAQALTDKILKELKSVKTLTFALGEGGNKIAFRNLKNVEAVSYKSLNAYQVYFGGGLVIDKSVFEKVSRASKGERQKGAQPSSEKGV